MRYPSIKTLLEIAGNEGRPAALAARKILDERTPMVDQWGRPYPKHSSHNDDAKLAAVDKAIGNHGVEWITFECSRENYSDPDGFAYSNAGDTYNATLVLYKRRFRVTTWGDMVESHEKNCAECRRIARERNA